MSDDPTLGLPDTPETRIARALWYIDQYGWIDGAHHKQWVLDQAVRALTGCPYEDCTRELDSDQVITFSVQGKSAEYTEFLAADEDFNEEEWEGIAP